MSYTSCTPTNSSCNVSLYVSGPMACFTRPEFRVERVSYDVPTPTAAAGILKAIHWKPQMEYVIRKIDVLKPISWDCHSTIERKGYKDAPLNDHMPRSNRILRDVAYVIHATIVGDNPAKHVAIFKRRVSKGQCYRHPHFGMRDYPISVFRAPTESDKPISESKPLGFMLHSLDWDNDVAPSTFRADLVNGSVLVPEAAA